jgi:ATP-dependent DNA helicase DinG
MALLIQEALKKRLPVIVEAGTGTGKTFGYLVPVILSGKKAVISTGTKNLQEQIYFKDIPLLAKIMDLNIDSIMMKGRQNYLCLYRYHQHFGQKNLFEKRSVDFGKRLGKWIETTQFGDRAELDWLKDDDTFWDAMSSTSEQCLGGRCIFFEDCFLNRLRREAARSKIVIVNHHLFFADMKVKKGGFGEIIPRFQVAVFDEAHKIEEIATLYLGESLSTNQLMELMNDLEKKAKGPQYMEKGGLKKHLNTVRAETENLRTLLNDREDRGRLDSDLLTAMSAGPARKIIEGLRYLREKPGLEAPDDSELSVIFIRAEEFEQRLGEILRHRSRNWLTWYEKRKNGLILYTSPLDISELMTRLVYGKLETTIFTSATLSTNGSFDFICSRLGLDRDVLSGMYASHFDFQTQTLMYIPKDLPVPDAPPFVEAVAERIKDILERTMGRALVLFTSHSNLNHVYAMIRDKIPYPIFKQGDAPRSLLLSKFRDEVHSVLLATGSFWQGVDVPGEALSCLVIDKLPFDSPGEPLIAARIEAIRERGGNPFMEYQLPSAVIALKQGLGRLIRNSSDRGILSVLDTRIMNSRYGKFFLESLPNIPITHDLHEIDRFIKTKN